MTERKYTYDYGIVIARRAIEVGPPKQGHGRLPGKSVG